MLIQLARFDSGEPVSVNVGHVRGIFPHRGGCLLVLAHGGAGGLHVREPYDTVRALVLSAARQAKPP